MDPMDKINNLIEKGRRFRSFDGLEAMPMDEANPDMIAKGVACVFNQPTTLFSCDGIDYKEVVDAKAFDSCDISDVIFNYNHSGKVMARTRNNTLQLNVDNTGLNVSAILGGTEEGRDMYEEIKGNYVDRMSFAFTVADEEYDQATHTRTIKAINKLYDVSAVDIPAYNTTSLSARSLIDLDKSIKDKLDSLNELKKRKLLLLLEI